MKTQYEIKKYIEHIRDSYVACQCVDAELHNLEWVYNVLEWIVEEPEPKRTIFDLTNKELEGLLNIAINGKINSDILGKIYKHDFAIDYMYVEHNQYISQDIQFRIYENHDFVLISDGIKKTMCNQVKLQQRLQEMLNVEIK